MRKIEREREMITYGEERARAIIVLEDNRSRTTEKLNGFGLVYALLFLLLHGVLLLFLWWLILRFFRGRKRRHGQSLRNCNPVSLFRVCILYSEMVKRKEMQNFKREGFEIVNCNGRVGRQPPAGLFSIYF